MDETTKKNILGSVAMRPRPEAAPIFPVVISPLMDRDEVSAYCGVSIAAWDRMVSSGKTPEPLKLGRLVKFRRADIDKWIELGLPDRAKFEFLISEE
jgi:predicted DNA-binding transcriptional regulator AlpA